MTVTSKCLKCNIRGVLSEDESDVFCPKCGFVIEEEFYKENQDLQSYQNSGNNIKLTGNPLNKYTRDKGLSTEIYGKNTDFKGSIFNTDMRKKVNDLRRLQKRLRVKDASEKNLIKGLIEVNKMIKIFNLPRCIKQETMDIFKKLSTLNYNKGKSTTGIILAIIYYLCRIHRIPVTLDELLVYSKIKKRRVTNFYRTILSLLKLRPVLLKPADYIDKYISILKFFDIKNIIGLRQKALESIKIIKQDRTISKSPYTVVAALIYYLISKDNQLSISAYCKKAKITEITLKLKLKKFKVLNV